MWIMFDLMYVWKNILIVMSCIYKLYINDDKSEVI